MESISCLSKSSIRRVTHPLRVLNINTHISPFTKAMELEKIPILLILLIPIIIFLTKRPPKKVPPGSMGLPFIGHSLSLLGAMRANKGEAWLEERIKKYGPISKLHLFGTPTVFLHGQAANKFIYTSDGDTLSNKQPAAIPKLLGERNILELSGDEHKRVRGALLTFLKLEGLKRYVGKIDEEVREHIAMHWNGKNQIIASPLMKTLTFNVICMLMFGIGKGTRRDSLNDLFKYIVEGMLSFPVNFPFTRFNRSLKARRKLEVIIMNLIREKKEALKNFGDSSQQDLITYLLNNRREGDINALSDNAIMDIVISTMVAGHDTTSVLLTFLIRLFATEPSIYDAVSQEHEQIGNDKRSGELLTWDDLLKMKSTWRVAMETLRMTPVAFLSFRTTLKDIEYDGYVIPKGWQVMWAANKTHMDEKIFEDPTEFDMTRFEKQPPPYSFVAFGGGARICPGYEFAKIETLILFHYLVTRFTWKLSTNDCSFGWDPLPVFNQGLPIRIIPKTV